MKSNLVSKSETASILRELEKEWGMKMPRMKNLRVHHVEQGGEIITGGGITVLHVGGQYLPFLTQEELLEKFPRVTVDMGAVRFMCNGADVMRPGIKSHSEFQRDDVVCIVEESQHKFLAVGRAAVASAEVGAMERGAVVKNIHHVSDRFWEAGKTIRH